MEKGESLQKVVLGNVGWNVQMNETGLLQTTFARVNSKWTKDVGMWPGTVKYIEENIGKTSGLIFQKMPLITQV